MNFRVIMGILSVVGPLLYFFVIASNATDLALGDKGPGIALLAQAHAPPAVAVSAVPTSRTTTKPAPSEAVADTFSRYSSVMAARLYLGGIAGLSWTISVAAILFGLRSLWRTLHFETRISRRRGAVIVVLVGLASLLICMPLGLSPEATARHHLSPLIVAMTNNTEDTSDKLRTAIAASSTLAIEGTIVEKGATNSVNDALEVTTYVGYVASLVLFVALAGLSFRRAPLRHTVDHLRHRLAELTWVGIALGGVLAAGVGTQLECYEVFVHSSPPAFQRAVQGLAEASVIRWGITGTVTVILALSPPLMVWRSRADALAIQATHGASSDKKSEWLKTVGLDFTIGRMTVVLVTMLAPVVVEPLLKIAISGH